MSDRQHQIESLMLEKAKERYFSSLDKIHDNRVEGRSAYGQKLTRHALPLVSEKLNEWLREAKTKKGGHRHSVVDYLLLLKPEVNAYLALKALINSITVERCFTTSCKVVGEYIRNEARMQAFAKVRPMDWKRYLRHIEKNQMPYQDQLSSFRKLVAKAKREGEDLPDAVVVPWKRNAKWQVGALMVEFVLMTGLFEVRYERLSKTRTRKIIVASEKTLDWINQANEFYAVARPVYLPTPARPKSWSPGRVAEQEALGHPLVKTRNRSYLKDILRQAEMPEVYRMVNALQGTRWRINRNVQAVFDLVWNNLGGDVGCVPSKDLAPLPPLPVDYDTNEDSKKAWNKAASEVHGHRTSQSSHITLIEQMEGVVNEFVRDDQFHYPYYLDFRGRAYTTPTQLNPQGSDLAKALLEFADAKPLETQEAADWLAIHGANLYGVDKVPFRQRIQWVKAHEDQIRRVVQDPMEERFWMDADGGDHAWTFLAWCYEWAGYLDQGLSYTSRLPVSVDGSNNGLQLLSLLSRDEDTALATNVAPDDWPHDVYQDVADKVIEHCRKVVEADDEDSAYAAYWLDFGINRKSTKRQVMVLPYGGTFHSCRAYTQEWYDALAVKPEGRSIIPKSRKRMRYVNWLAGVIWDSIQASLGRATDVMAWLQECAGVHNDADLSIYWEAPTGFPVVQQYLNLRPRTIETTVHGKVIRMKVQDETDKLDRRRQKTSIAPNVIHSLDAAAMCRTVCKALDKGITSFAMVHDSYGTHAADMPALAYCLREAHVEIFSKDILAELSDRWGKACNYPMPPLPEYGRLKVEDLMRSEFFFA